MASSRRATCERTGQLLDCSLQKFSGPPEAAGTFIELYVAGSFLPENCRLVSFLVPEVDVPSRNSANGLKESRGCVCLEFQ